MCQRDWGKVYAQCPALEGQAKVGRTLACDPSLPTTEILFWKRCRKEEPFPPGPAAIAAIPSTLETLHARDIRQRRECFAARTRSQYPAIPPPDL